MSAKTILVQMHHKSSGFDERRKKLAQHITEDEVIRKIKAKLPQARKLRIDG